MKQIILNFLANKSRKEFHPLNLLIKGNAKVKTREEVRALRNELKAMTEIEFEGLDQLDTINSNGHNPSYPDGRAMPTQYFNFDDTNISARGMAEAKAATSAPRPLTPPAITEFPIFPPDPVIPVVSGHPLDIQEKADIQIVEAHQPVAEPVAEENHSDIPV